jgi:hypothetical protein
MKTEQFIIKHIVKHLKINYMETKFEKRLIGRDEKSIEKKTEDFKYSVRELNDLAANWQEYFNEKFTPEKVSEILSAKDIPHLIQSHFVLTRNNERAKLARKGEYKLSHLIDETPIPPFEHLKNEIVSFKIGLNSRKFTDELEDNIEKLYFAGIYIFPNELKNSIEAKHTYYTRDEHENAALQLVENVCNSLNAFNDLGLSISSSDLPIAIQQCVSDVQGTKTFSQLQSGERSGKLYIIRLAPFWGMFKRENNSLLNQIRKNLKFQ